MLFLNLLVFIIYIYIYLFRSQTNGNCLYSSTSLLLIGDNSLVDNLRAMTSIELFLHGEFYSKHPSFLETQNKNPGLLMSTSVILKLCVSNDSFNTDLASVDLVKHEALLNCDRSKWCSFLCILALSSAINKSIVCSYPDFGLIKYKHIFHRKITPRSGIRTSSDLHILFCSERPIQPGIAFKPDHFVPLIPAVKFLKNKPIMKRPYTSSQTKSSSSSEKRNKVQCANLRSTKVTEMVFIKVLPLYI